MRKQLWCVALSAALLVPGALVVIGCDETVSHKETVKENADGTGSRKEETVKQKSDGTVVEEKKESVDKTPDRPR